MDYSNYSSSWSQSYKQGRILGASFGSVEVIRVLVDKTAWPIQVKSVHAAKLLITAHAKKYGSTKN